MELLHCFGKDDISINNIVIMDWNWNVDLFEVGFCLDLGLVMLGLGFLIICRLMGFQNNFFVLLLLWGL